MEGPKFTSLSFLLTSDLKSKENNQKRVDGQKMYLVNIENQFKKLIKL